MSYRALKAAVNFGKGKKMKAFVECKKCGFEVVPNEDGTCYNCSQPMEVKK